MNLLILVGTSGLAKSRTVRRLSGAKTTWIEGNAAPYGMYRKLYRHRDEFVVIVDVDSLSADKNGIRLFKCLCQTEEEKSVAWHSAARSLEREGIPREFVTRSRVVAICNDWQTMNRNVAALQDRGHGLVFEPTAAEVHRKTGEWFTTEPDVYRWFGENLNPVREPSMRLYLRAAELKRTGMDWMEVLPLAPENPRQRLVAELAAEGSFSTLEARAREFGVWGGGCRATYSSHARRLEHRGCKGNGRSTPPLPKTRSLAAGSEGIDIMSVQLDSSSLEKYLKQFTDRFTPELAEHFATLPMDPEFQARQDELGEKANEGRLTPDERSEYETYIEAMDVMALLRVKALARAKEPKAGSSWSTRHSSKRRGRALQTVAQSTKVLKLYV